MEFGVAIFALWGCEGFITIAVIGSSYDAVPFPKGPWSYVLIMGILPQFIIVIPNIENLHSTIQVLSPKP